jgi:DNA-binding Xre family transcriptional regulator
MTNTSEFINCVGDNLENLKFSLLFYLLDCNKYPVINSRIDMLLTDFEYLNNSEDAFKRKISLQIKTLRRQNRVTQQKFYSETNINIARLESGRVDIRLDTLRKVCYYFDVSLSGFFHGIY